MRMNTLNCGMIAAVALTGCAALQTQQIPLTATTCENTRVCVIPVTVVSCVVSIPADRVDVVIKGRNAAILWHLTLPSVAQKYVFDANNGVMLKATDPDAQFTAQGPVFNNLAYFWLDRNTNWSSYPYTINIFDTTNNRACPPLDPKIINQ